MSRHRSGPVRSEHARRAILEATARQFSAHGYDGFTIQGVADEAGVGKQTIYRWWSGKPELLTDCLLEGLLWDKRMSPSNTGDVEKDVREWLMLIAQAASSTEGAALLRSLMSAATSNEVFGERLHQALSGEGALQNRLEIAQRDGQLAADAPVALLSDLLIGAIILRTLSWQDTDAEVVATLTRFTLKVQRAGQ
ncbi:MAG: TetR/AcrR family transcriptional regulator [Gulosibacter sp.]|uniref:TetR/AcrR family transcriptional regulator n=1 Tax=Gulosibacter sp. TaxID=2817531 RepID=UPI003F9163F0